MKLVINNKKSKETVSTSSKTTTIQASDSVMDELAERFKDNIVFSGNLQDFADKDPATLSPHIRRVMMIAGIKSTFKK